MVLKAFRANNNKIVGGGDSSRFNKIIMNLFKNLTRMLNIRAIKKSNFLTPNAKKDFNYLKQEFIEVLIF